MAESKRNRQNPRRGFHWCTCRIPCLYRHSWQKWRSSDYCRSWKLEFEVCYQTLLNYFVCCCKHFYISAYLFCRQVMLTGQSNRLHRLLYKIMDEACMKVREAQQNGKNVSLIGSKNILMLNYNILGYVYNSPFICRWPVFIFSSISKVG